MKNLITSIMLSCIIFNMAWAKDLKVEPLSKNLQTKLIELQIWQPSCPVKLEDLRLVTLDYYDLAERFIMMDILF